MTIQTSEPELVECLRRIAASVLRIHVTPDHGAIARGTHFVTNH